MKQESYKNTQLRDLPSSYKERHDKIVESSRYVGRTHKGKITESFNQFILDAVKEKLERCEG